MSDDNGSGKDKGTWPVRDLPPAWCWVGFDVAFSNETTSNRKLAQKSYESEGTLAVIDQGQSKIAGYTSDTSLEHPSQLPVVVFGDHTRCVKFVDFPFVQGADGVKVLRPREVLDPKFAFHALRAVALPSKGYARHYKFLSATEFPVPPLNEQRRIVAKLEALQSRSRRARSALDTVPPLLEKLRQSILAAAFRGDLTKNWRAKHKDVEPASELLKRILIERRKKWEEAALAKMKAKGKAPADDGWKAMYKEPEPVDATGLPKLPEGWCWASVDALATRVTDGTHQSPIFTEAGVPFIVIANVIGGTIEWSSVNKWVSRATYEENTARCVPERGDVLYTAVGSYGVAVTVDVDRSFMFQRHIAHIKPLSTLVRSHVLAMMLNAPQSKARADEVARGVAQRTVTLGELCRFPIPVAPFEEQRRLFEYVEEGLDALRRIEKRWSALHGGLATLDRATLAKAFRGGLVQQDPNDEPADVMLARTHQANGVPTNGNGADPRTPRVSRGTRGARRQEA